MVSIGTLVAFIIVSLGMIILRVREPELPRAFKVSFSPFVVSALLYYLLWSRHRSALNDGGDGLIPTAAPAEDEVPIHSEKDSQ
jgi:APA family basic amino acid/polyamine antiporter